MDAIFAEFFRLWGNIPYAIAGLLPRDMLMFPLCLYPLTVICSAIAAVKAIVMTLIYFWQAGNIYTDDSGFRQLYGVIFVFGMLANCCVSLWICMWLGRQADKLLNIRAFVRLENAIMIAGVTHAAYRVTRRRRY